MKKEIIKKIEYILIIFGLLFIFICIKNTTYVEAKLGGPLDNNILVNVTDEDYNLNAPVLSPVKKIFSTIYTIFQVFGLGGVVYTGVKYMYADGKDKAEIKKSLIWVVVGVVFLFAAPSIIDFISDAAKNTLTP